MINCLKDPLHVLMRVLLCKIHCSLFCFCKPFSDLYTASSLNLENSPHKSLKTLVSAIDDDDDDDDNDVHQEIVNHHVDGHRNEEGIVEDSKEEEEGCVGDSLVLKSSLRKFDSNSIEVEKKKEKKKVQWVDVMGIKELADIREFEPSEEDDIDSDRGKACVCGIL